MAAGMPGPKANFQREQFGGKLGGPIVKTKLFFLADVERTKQDLFASIPLSAPFSAFSGGSDSPFRETDVLGRLDWQLKGTHVFYRFAYYQDLFGTGGYQPFDNKNYTPSHVVGADFSAGGVTHSIRFGYLFYRNNIADAVRGSSLPFANYPVSLLVGPLNTLAVEVITNGRMDVHDHDRLVSVARFGEGIQIGEVEAGVTTGEPSRGQNNDATWIISYVQGPFFLFDIINSAPVEGESL
jgi:hypothetical protein